MIYKVYLHGRYGYNIDFDDLTTATNFMKSAMTALNASDLEISIEVERPQDPKETEA